jgi:hypothetical protein
MLRSAMVDVGVVVDVEVEVVVQGDAVKVLFGW